MSDPAVQPVPQVPPIHRTLPPIYAHYSKSNAALMMRFCSLGGNCEFGLAQRYAGAEPLDLLRFTNTTISTLAYLFKKRCEDFARPDLLTVKQYGQEWILYNKVYNVNWHTFVHGHHMTAEEVLNREIRRLPRLTERLIEALTEGNRIFVRIPLPGNNPPEKISDLVDAMGAFGHATLFYVTLADDIHPPFTVAWEGDRLLHGWIDRFSVHGNMPDTVPVESWLRLCDLAVQAVDRSVSGDR